MKALFGYLPGEDLSYEAALAQVPDKYRPKVIATIEESRARQAPFHLECPVTGFHDRRERWVRVLGGFSIPEGSIHHLSGVIMDITEQKQNELRKNRFIGMVSHELKTPLTALKAYVQMLNVWAKKQKDNFTIGALSKVEKQIKKMAAMITGFLNLSGVESGMIHLDKQDFFLDELIREVIEETAFILAGGQISLVEAGPLRVNADREKIEQVIINLLNNAVKYSAKIAPVEVYYTQAGDMVQVSIKDSGIGISQEDIARLFEPHYRVESKETQNIKGFGIGLYLCAEIIKRHQGKIWAESEPGKGSTFSFTLPLG